MPVRLTESRCSTKPLADVNTLDPAFYAIGNSMLKKLRRKLITPESFEKALVVLSTISEIAQVRKFGELDARRVSKMANDAGSTFHDASYLTLALVSNEALATNDGILKKKVDGMGLRTLAV